ncbi:MAG TPA: hypothetical protein VFS87_06430, partial [Qipengyuania sp.]|nr:hypothetical protein [Qipengyuania sp.]
MRMLAPHHPAWAAEQVRARRFDDPPAAAIFLEVQSARAAGLAPGFAQKVAANALGIAQRELAADRREGIAGDSVEELILDTLGKLEVDQPGYPGLRALREASGLGHPPAIGERSP